VTESRPMSAIADHSCSNANSLMLLLQKVPPAMRQHCRGETRL
jgi:hypothetical protein